MTAAPYDCDPHAAAVISRCCMDKGQWLWRQDNRMQFRSAVGLETRPYQSQRHHLICLSCWAYAGTEKWREQSKACQFALMLKAATRSCDAHGGLSSAKPVQATSQGPITQPWACSGRSPRSISGVPQTGFALAATATAIARRQSSFWHPSVIRCIVHAPLVMLAQTWQHCCAKPSSIGLTTKYGFNIYF